MASTVEELLAKLEQAASTADLTVRYHLSEQLTRLACSIATPRQIMHDYGFECTNQAVGKIASDLEIFAILAQSKEPLKGEQIATKCSADPALVDRVLRHLASTSTIAETGPGTFAANEATRCLASAAGKGNIFLACNFLNKVFQELPQIIKEGGYKNPDSTAKNAFQETFKTNKPLFQFLRNDPEAIRNIHPALRAFESPVCWASVVPWTEKLEGSTDPKVPIFVDIGGGHGAQCLAFRKATKDRFSCRVINQDLAETIASAPKYDDIEMMAQNFYEEQQIKGAKIYYIRHCIHDYPDDLARKILQRIKDAMGPQSYLLIDEVVLPDTGASRIAMQLDIAMMAMHNATERTLVHWRRLLEEVGLEIKHIYPYDPELETSIIEAVPSKS